MGTNRIQAVSVRSAFGRLTQYSSLGEAVRQTRVGYRASYDQTGRIVCHENPRDNSYEFRDELGLLIEPDEIEAIIHGIGPPDPLISRWERARLRLARYGGLKSSFRQHGIEAGGGRAKEWRPRVLGCRRRYLPMNRAYQADLFNDDLDQVGRAKLRKRALWDAWDDDWLAGRWKRRCWKRYRAHQWRGE